MRILVLGRNVWDDTDSTGNTFSNWFGEWSDSEFYFLYTRDNIPNNHCCRHYMSISPLEILRNLLTPWKIGRIFTLERFGKPKSTAVSFESKAINSLNGKGRKLALLAIDLLYSTKIWMNGRFRSFIKEANPDIVFLSTMSCAYYYQTLKFIKRETSAKIVQFVADDLYGEYMRSGDLLGIINKKRFPKLLSMADKLYGASPQLCENYQRLFEIPFTPLYKGCTISEPRREVNQPVKMMYAGNLRFGRLETLNRLAMAIDHINCGKKQVTLDIYSNTYISEGTRKLLVIPGSVELHDVLPYKEITALLRQSDIVLHVESFEENAKLTVRYSFSTKIIDCLQSGSTLMVIGPEGISSVEYPRKVDGTIVIDNVDDIEKELKLVIENSNSLPKRAASINKFAIANHSISNVRKAIRRDFEFLLTR